MKNFSKYSGNELKYLKLVLKKKLLKNSNSWTQIFEEKFSYKYKKKFGISFNSGTSTLHAALLACGVKPGDEVISPALTVIMDTSATIHCHAIPVYADINEDDFTISPQDIEKKITPKTKAIIVVHLYGMMPNMDEIVKICETNNSQNCKTQIDPSLKIKEELTKSIMRLATKLEQDQKNQKK